MLKVGLVGVPNSGKTLLIRSIVKECKIVEKLRVVKSISGYARGYISKYGFINSLSEQYRILVQLYEWENLIFENKIDLMITDCPIFLGFLYCCDLPKSDNKDVMFFNDIFKKMVTLNYPISRYDIIFHLSPLPELIDNGVGGLNIYDSKWRQDKDALIHSIFQIFKPNQYYIVKAKETVSRTNECLEIMKSKVRKNNNVVATVKKI